MVYWRQMPPSESSENPAMTTIESPRPLFVPEVRKNEPLSDEELGNLLAAIGNNEAKAITLIAMGKGVIYDRYDLDSEMIRTQGDTLGWRQSRGVPFNYCANSLENIGLVAKSVSDSNLETWGYIKTDYGEEQGDALAGLLLDFSLRHPEVSLYDIFGSTSSGGKDREIEASLGLTGFKNRSPLACLKLIWELATTNELRVIDLGNNHGKPNQEPQEYLSRLKECGLIHYEFTAEHQPYAQYQLALNSPLETPGYKTRQPLMTKDVYELLKRDPNKIWMLEDLRVAYFAKKKAENPDFDRNNTSTKNRLSRVLSNLERAGYVYRPGGRRYERTTVWVDEEHKLLFIDLLTLIDQFQNQDSDTLRKGRMLAVSFSPRQIGTLMAKAKEHSPQANKFFREETEKHILSFLNDHSKSTTREVRKSIIDYQKRNVSTGNIRAILRKLKSGGKIKETLEKGINKWSLASEQDN